MTEMMGKKCNICIRCGRCGLPTEDSLCVVTDSFLKPAYGEGVSNFALADIGTTTIAMELYDKRGSKLAEYVCPNPQRIFGADVISRIQAAENNINARQMQAQVLAVLRDGLKHFADKMPDTAIECLYVAGNTTMLYLLMGHDAKPLGSSPFRADYLQSEGFEVEGVQATTLPGLSAFLGSDVFAGILACGMNTSEEINLLVDLGTNGEMVLGNCEKMLACSTAAGPVFDSLCDKDGKTVWGADVIHLTAKLLEAGLVDETGLLTEDYFEGGVDIGGVHITQEVIRNLQTAKAAIATGIEYLLKEYEVSTEQVKNVYLAGGMGYFMQEADAIRLGLLPGAFQDKVVSVGNAALAGMYVYSRIPNREGVAKHITQMVQPRNLARWQVFGECFIENMDFEGR